MKSRIVLLVSLLQTACLFFSAAHAEDHAVKYKDGIPGDKALKEASTLNVQIPVMCREWHIWWGAPHGSYPHMPRWQHWKGQRRYGKFDWSTTIEQTRPDSSWRRWLNCVGYPLLGPYDASQPDIIRWQLETAKNTGLECLHIHLWPSIWDEGQDFAPMPIFDMVIEEAAKLNYPVAIHDEIQFRRPNITKAQELKNSIKRTTLLLERYGKHPGMYKIDNMPVYYFQNWSKWITAKDLETYFKTVEEKVGPVYWIVEMADIAEYYKIPQIKAIVSHSNGWFLHTPPYGLGPHPWDELLKTMDRAAKLARKHGKKFGVQIKTRFDHSNDRGQPNKKLIKSEDCMFLVDSIKKSLQCKPDFFVLAQWNDFEECAFIEPAWDFDGFNGDPYRYCRVIAKSMNKDFRPAPLPKREQVDPFVRHKLYGDTKSGDMGPVFQKPVVKGDALTATWPSGVKAQEVRVIQGELASWSPQMTTFQSRKLRLANTSILDKDGNLSGNCEMRFYAPGLITSTPKKLWLGLRMQKLTKGKITINYRSLQENYRIDSRWEKAHVGLRDGYQTELPDGNVMYWTPMYRAQFVGQEGDVLIHLKGADKKVSIKQIIIWDPDMKEASVTPAETMELPKTINPGQPFVVVAYDALKNAGPPRLILPAGGK